MLESKIHMLIPGILFTIASALAGIFFFLNKDQKKISLKIFLLYTLCTVVAFALAGLVGLMPVESALSYFIGLQFLFLLLGVAHCFALYYLDGGAHRESFLYEFIYTLYVTLIGSMVFFLLFSILNHSDPSYPLYFLPGMFFFIIPFLLLKTFDFLLAIPQEEYTKWYFPVNQELKELSDDDLDDKYTIVIWFELDKAEEANNIIRSSSKAPLRWIYGDLYALFLDTYNDSYPGKQIQYLDQFSQPQGWNFYIKPRKWYQSPRYIDPALTVNENGLNDKDTIVCERVK